MGALARWLDEERLRVYPTMIVVAAAIGFVATQLIRPGLNDVSGTIVGADFLAFWSAGKLVVSGQAGGLYDLGAHAAIQTGLQPDDPPRFCAFMNPPFATALYVPFGALPYLVGLAGWWALQVGALVAATVIGSRATHLEIKTGLWAVLRFFPALACLMDGQATGLLLLATVALVVNLRVGRSWTAGLAAGFLLIKPQLALPWLVVLAVQRDLRALLAAGLVGVGWLGVGELVAPGMLDDWLRFVPVAAALLRDEGYPGWGLASGLGMWVAAFQSWAPLAVDVLTPAGLVAALGVIAALWWREGDLPPSPRRDLLVAETSVIVLLACAHLFFYDLALLLPSLLIAHHAVRPSGDRLLGGGPLLDGAGWLYIGTFFGPYVVLLQWLGSEALGLPRVAVNVTVLALVGWAFTLDRARREAGR